MSRRGRSLGAGGIREKERERERGKKSARWLAGGHFPRLRFSVVSQSSVIRVQIDCKFGNQCKSLESCQPNWRRLSTKKRKKSPVCLLTCVIVGQLWEDGGNWPTPVTSIDGPTAIRDNQQRQFSLFFRGNILRGAVQGNRKLCADTQHMYITDRP